MSGQLHTNPRNVDFVAPADASGSRQPSLTAGLPQARIDGAPVHLVDEAGALAVIADAAAHRTSRPLGVVSINLDHVYHFSTARSERSAEHSTDIEWFNLVDGAPIAAQVKRMTGTSYPKLSGSDLIGPVLDDAALHGHTIAVVGGSSDVTEALKARLSADWPGLIFAGHWVPSRAELATPDASHALAKELQAANVDILLVCLGKPRQEDWIAAYGAETGAGALLAFGAVVDFLAGRVSRAPRWISSAGFDWAWRLMLEPRRLFRRYVIQGPGAYVAVRRSTNG